jgi:hypothetical protein
MVARWIDDINAFAMVEPPVYVEISAEMSMSRVKAVDDVILCRVPVFVIRGESLHTISGGL